MSSPAFASANPLMPPGARPQADATLTTAQSLALQPPMTGPTTTQYSELSLGAAQGRAAAASSRPSLGDHAYPKPGRAPVPLRGGRSRSGGASARGTGLTLTR